MTAPEQLHLRSDPMPEVLDSGKRAPSHGPAPSHAPAPSRSGRRRQVRGAAGGIDLADLVPSRVLDACSIAMRNMGRSSINCLGITSCRRNEGRSTIARGMAMTLAHEYQRLTLLVDLDLERPSLAETFGIKSGPGVAELLRDEYTIGSCLQQVDNNLMVVTAGGGSNAIAYLLRETNAAKLFDVLSASCEALVADLPPLTPGSGAAQLADMCSAVALVVRSGMVDRSEVAEAVSYLARPVFGLVNDVQPQTPRLVRRMLGLER